MAFCWYLILHWQSPEMWFLVVNLKPYTTPWKWKNVYHSRTNKLAVRYRDTATYICTSLWEILKNAVAVRWSINGVVSIVAWTPSSGQATVSRATVVCRLTKQRLPITRATGLKLMRRQAAILHHPPGCGAWDAIWCRHQQSHDHIFLNHQTALHSKPLPSVRHYWHESRCFTTSEKKHSSLICTVRRSLYFWP